MVFNTQARENLCEVWTKKYRSSEERLYGPKSPEGAHHVGYHGTSVTSYAAYLSVDKRLRQPYKFTDSNFNGSCENFF